MSKEDVIDDLTEIVEETAELAGEVHAWRCGLSRRQHSLQLIVLGAVAGAAGAVIAHVVTKKQLQTKYEKIAAKEIAEAKAFYTVLHKKDDMSTPKKVADKLMPKPELREAADALLTYQGKNDIEPKEIVTEVVEDTVTNVFAESSVDDNFDYEEELKNRSPSRPYIISEEEFLQGEAGFNQSSITYYAGDGALADEEDTEIPFIDPVIGEDNLRFGHGSSDARTVYIRNEMLSCDYEVLKSDGKYAHEVLGLEHSDGGSRGRRQRNTHHRVRGDDE